MRVITLRPGEAPKFNDIPALLDTIEAVQHFCGGDICENRIGASGNIDHPDGCKHLAGPRLPCGCWQCDTKPVRCWACLFGSGAGGHAL